MKKAEEDEGRTPKGTLRKCIVVKQNHVYSLKRPVERGANMSPPFISHPHHPPSYGFIPRD